MKPTLFVVAIPLLVSGCASTLPDVVASNGYPDSVSDVQLVGYRNVVGSYVHRVPTDPKPWREMNDRQAPKGGA